MVSPLPCSRRAWLALVLAQCGACAGDPAAAPAPQPLLLPWQRVSGGFLASPTGPTRSFVRFVRPQLVAVRGFDLLVGDLALQRLWRVDPVAGTLVGIAGVTLTPQTALLLGADGSAWVLDAPAGQVLRFARDGRLLQTWRPGTTLPTPVGIALADGGATLLVADGLGAHWAEQRSPGAPLRLVEPVAAGGRRVGGVDAIATRGADVLVLDRLAGVVHRVDREGAVRQTLGHGDLVQPVALGVDRRGRVFVLEAAGSVKLLAPDRPAQVLALPKASALAVEGDVLAVVDEARAELQVLRLGAGP